jgi:hypothetical protein
MTRRGGDAETRRARNRIGIPVSPCPRVPVSVLSPNCRIRPPLLYHPIHLPSLARTMAPRATLASRDADHAFLPINRGKNFAQDSLGPLGFEFMRQFNAELFGGGGGTRYRVLDDLLAI